ncbi:uncharacterized protein C2845_PM05G18230 [Panicum miliaceum]|uniref:Mixed lineage kinase domain-containing protein n=1 Tax=Panicum miliaceum TaxID=4540 RepID=A0A3L6T102_PANMI|nr:uncharacterized protein C2845_PM05G18230 [Panicum miliaceum]
MVDVVNIVLKIGELGFKIKTAVDTADDNKEVCVEIGTRVSRITEIVKKLESTGKTEDSTLRNPLNDLKETLDKAYEHIMECQNKNLLSKVIQSKALKNTLDQVNKKIMEHTAILEFANNASNNGNISLIADHIKSGVHVTLPKFPIYNAYDSVDISDMT